KQKACLGAGNDEAMVPLSARIEIPLGERPYQSVVRRIQAERQTNCLGLDGLYEPTAQRVQIRHQATALQQFPGILFSVTSGHRRSPCSIGSWISCQAFGQF